MRTRRFTTFGLFAALTCISAFVSCKQQPKLAPKGFDSNRLVTIEMSPDGGCEVDYPVTFMRMRNNAKIGWASDDNVYTVHFVAGNPFNPTINYSIPVPAAAAGGKSTLQTLQNSGSGGYYKYEILDANNKPCKTADDDHDTGLNIKP